jgi:hypothetical protein
MRRATHRLAWIGVVVVAALVGAPASAWVTLTHGKWSDPAGVGNPGGVMTWFYSTAGEPANVAAARGASPAPPAIAAAADTWTDDVDNSMMFQFQGQAVNNVILVGLDNTADTTAAGDDIQVIPVGNAPAVGNINGVVIAAGPNGVIDTVPVLDDVLGNSLPTNHRDRTNTVGWDNLSGTTLGVHTRFRSIVAGIYILQSDIRFTTTPQTWEPGPGLAKPAADGDYDLESVALHEFGHALNLTHPDQFAPQRAPAEYAKKVMNSTIGRGHNKRDLSCDEQSGAAFIYQPGPPKHPPELGVSESRPMDIHLAAQTSLLSTRYFGGCDFGDAPDPFIATIGEYPSLEGPYQPPLPGGVNKIPVGPNGEETFAPIYAGARHKDCTMEWLGPLPAGLPPRDGAIPAPGNAQCDSQDAGKTNVTYEPESLQGNADELDDGVSISLTGLNTFTLHVMVNTSGLAGRYSAADPNQLLYLNGWEDWDCDGTWDGGGEHVVFWNGTPAADVAVSANFVSGVAMGAGRLLRFDVTMPPGATPCYGRFRLDYAEDAGANPRPWTKQDKISRSPGIGTLPEAPNDTRGILHYGEVEDYPFPVAFSPNVFHLDFPPIYRQTFPGSFFSLSPDVRVAGAVLTDPLLGGGTIHSLNAQGVVTSGTLGTWMGPLTPLNTLPVRGELAVCLLTGCPGPAIVPLTSASTRGVGLGGTVTAGTGTTFISIQGSTWRASTAFLTVMTPMGASSLISEKGFAHTPGSASLTPSATAGVLKLVTPFRVTSGMTSSEWGGFATMTVIFAPEPLQLLLLASGVACLLVLGRRRMHRMERMDQ